MATEPSGFRSQPSYTGTAFCPESKGICWAVTDRPAVSSTAVTSTNAETPDAHTVRREYALMIDLPDDDLLRVRLLALGVGHLSLPSGDFLPVLSVGHFV